MLVAALPFDYLQHVIDNGDRTRRPRARRTDSRVRRATASGSGE